MLATDCSREAEQLCSSGQRATALYVFYLRWNLYEPEVTSTWMGPSVFFLFWRHFTSAGGTLHAPASILRRSLCWLRRMKQCWVEEMFDLPTCTTVLRTIEKPPRSSIDHLGSSPLCTCDVEIDVNLIISHTVKRAVANLLFFSVMLSFLPKLNVSKKQEGNEVL